ncbi:chymotrypsin-2-like [Pseudomyrmex gracilis]|uniref:chymotrypsin-2-like n=1 Tax=Pseudomyrmex gracilis TaxID=219809 RepID=UPI0009956FA9|nr:chymotrypsin-2-like [Pseudomyrmex gracilis]
MNITTALLIACLAITAYGFPNSHIVGGSDAPDGRYPHQVSLRRSKNNNHFCGGAIISKRYVITAAHCLQRLTDPSEIHVAVGSNYLDTPRAIYQVKKYIKHPNYNSLLNIDDIGLIRVAKSIKFNDDTSTIALPTVDNNYDNYSLKVTGWGRLWTDGPRPNRLQQVTVKGYSQKKCNKFYKNNIIESHICTFTREGKGMCNGDSGGPLVADDVLVGIVSYGTSPCGSGFPDVFTRVFHYRAWIKSHTGI